MQLLPGADSTKGWGCCIFPIFSKVDVHVYHVFGGWIRFKDLTRWWFTYHRPNKKFSNDVYQSMYIKCTYSTTPPQNVFFHPKTHTKTQKKTRRNARMWRECCNLAQKRWERVFCRRFKVPFGSFPSKTSGLKHPRHTQVSWFFLLSRFAWFFCRLRWIFFWREDMSPWFCGGYVTYITLWLTPKIWCFKYFTLLNVNFGCFFSLPLESLDPPKKRGLDVFFAGFWDLQTTRFEIPRFLGCFLLGFHGIFRCLGMVPISRTLISLHLKVSNTWGRRRLVRK